MFTKRIRLVACAGLVSGALTAASLGGAFAAPVADSVPPTVTPIPTVTTTVPTAATGVPTSSTTPRLRPRRERVILIGFLKNISQLFQITPRTLIQELGQGTSLAQLAPRYGKTATDVEALLTNALKTRLDKRVAAGKITQEQETNRLAKVGPRIDKLVNANLAKYIHRIERRRRTGRGSNAAAPPTPTPVPQQ